MKKDFFSTFKKIYSPKRINITWPIKLALKNSTHSDVFFLACWYQYCMLNKTLNEECFQIFTIFYKHYAINLCRLLKILNNPLIVFHATSRIWISGFQKRGKNSFLDATKVEGIPHDECWSMHSKWKWHVSLLDWSIYLWVTFPSAAAHYNFW